MKKRSIALIIAGSLIVLGLCVAFLGLLSINFDFRRLSTDKMVDKTYTIIEDFEKIYIHTDESDIQFVLTEDGACRVEVHEKEKIPHAASVENGTLNITNVDHRKWYHHIGFHFGTPKMTVYLPKAIYMDLDVSSTTGDITVPSDFFFENGRIKTTTGDVSHAASVEHSLFIQTTTGDAFVKNIAVGEGISVNLTSGDIKMDNVTCKSMTLHVSTGRIEIDTATVTEAMNVKTTTGDVKMTNALIGAHLKVEATTGDVTLAASDAKTIDINTNTGDVRGTLLSPKTFQAKTTTGDINVPRDTEGGICNVKTTTGDITFSVQ